MITFSTNPFFIIFQRFECFTTLMALTSFRNYNATIPQHLSNEEFEALKILSVNFNLIIRKADKGNLVVLERCLH